MTELRDKVMTMKMEMRENKEIMTQPFNDTYAVEEAFHLWCAHFSAKKLESLISLYEPSAILLPTLADNIIKNHEDRLAYFANLMKNPKLRVTVIESHIRLINDIAINSGFYTFSFEKDGQLVEIPSRFTFIYKKKSTGWMILDHHSSQMPQV